MSENNKSYRIRTNVGSEYNGDLNLDINLLQDYDIFEILSLKIETESLYKYHTSKYGCVVGRVLANGGVGVPNAKISMFIKANETDLDDPVLSYLYPYTNTRDKNRDNIRYNLLTDKKTDDCHQNVGTFPNKRLVLDDDNVIDIFDKYYKFTTTSNESGDYMIFGVPVGENTLHCDIDLSDIGILSQKPRDMLYKGYTMQQFENASMFKKDENIDNLAQIISQDSSIYVNPFWGDEAENEGQIKITRKDIDVSYKFEPTCIFIGSIVSDEKSNSISKNCIPHERMGKMDRLTTGKGTIEMIRKTLGGGVESKIIQGNELIDGNGTWCYQIPMNLDYVITDEYGKLVPTDDTERGLPTRTRVRFRVSLADYESDYATNHLVKVLVPNNPQMIDEGQQSGHLNFDYEFGDKTTDESYRDLFWNNVYSVKSYIPRFQKGNRQRNKNFTGFKAVNVNGGNNPIPYNNMRVNLTFLFVFQCLIFKSLVIILKTLNKIIRVLNKLTCTSSKTTLGFGSGLVYLTLDGGMCPSLDGNYVAPGTEKADNQHDIITHTYKNVFGDEYTISTNSSSVEVDKGTAGISDERSADGKNGYLTSAGTIETSFIDDDDTQQEMLIFNNEDYFVKCVELQFALEYEVIQFDFYNDWINGMIYIPRWMAEVKRNKDKVYYCGNNFKQYRRLVQQCAVGYDSGGTIAQDNFGCRGGGKQFCHKKPGRRFVSVFGPDRGIVKKTTTSLGQNVYYLRPSEIISKQSNTGRRGGIPYKVNLFSTDIILLGSVNKCNQYGLPTVDGYPSSSYLMPPPTGELVSDTQEMGVSGKFISTSGDCDASTETMIEWMETQIQMQISDLYNSDGIGGYDRNYHSFWWYNHDDSLNKVMNVLQRIGNVSFSTNNIGENYYKYYYEKSYDKKSDEYLVDESLYAISQQGLNFYDGNNDVFNPEEIHEENFYDYYLKLKEENGITGCTDVNFEGVLSACTDYYLDVAKAVVYLAFYNHNNINNNVLDDVILNTISKNPTPNSFFNSQDDEGNNEYELLSAITGTSLSITYGGNTCVFDNYCKFIYANVGDPTANCYSIFGYGTYNGESEKHKIYYVYDGSKSPVEESIGKITETETAYGYSLDHDGTHHTYEVNRHFRRRLYNKLFGYDFGVIHYPGLIEAKILKDIWEQLYYNGKIDGYNYNITKFYKFNKKTVYEENFDNGLLDGVSGNPEDNNLEIAGIDWGYNPFVSGKDDDKTTNVSKQIAGHFLEIGCTYSLTNLKSCVNLTRICELGSEMSQGHYYWDNANNEWKLIDPSGFIAQREISDVGIRTTFAALNSNKLKTIYDTNTGYLKYDFHPYIANKFGGEWKNRLQSGSDEFNTLVNTYGLMDGKSKSYKAFRFGTENDDIRSKFALMNTEYASGGYIYDNLFYLPQYENSFYFYFGLKDGNTAIDRLYSEYYSKCDNNDVDEDITLEKTNIEAVVTYYNDELTSGDTLYSADTVDNFNNNNLETYKTRTYQELFGNPPSGKIFSDKWVDSDGRIIDVNSPIYNLKDNITLTPKFETNLNN